jgi:hypothetical protein
MQKPLQPEGDDNDDDDEVPSTFIPHGIVNLSQLSRGTSISCTAADSDEDILQDASSSNVDISLSQVCKQALSKQKKVPRQW